MPNCDGNGNGNDTEIKCLCRHSVNESQMIKMTPTTTAGATTSQPALPAVKEAFGVA